MSHNPRRSPIKTQSLFIELQSNLDMDAITFRAKFLLTINDHNHQVYHIRRASVGLGRALPGCKNMLSKTKRETIKCTAGKENDTLVLKKWNSRTYFHLERN